MAKTATTRKPRKTRSPRRARAAARRKRPRPALTQKWTRLLRRIPGYDPIATADPDMRFDPAAAQLALDFFPEMLHHVEGAVAGKPFVLEIWQRSVIANLFGWKRADGTRRYRRALLYVPRKNGKTPLGAGIGLYVLFCDPEPGQQNYIAGADSDQAALAFRHAKGMVEHEPELSSRCTLYGGKGGTGHKSIVRPHENSYLRVISADAHTKFGQNPHFIDLEELHAQPTRRLYDALRTGAVSQNRRQPLFLCITTADWDHPSVCNEEYDYARKVRDGVIHDPGYLPVIYEAPHDADWRSPKTWAIANPNLGVSVSKQALADLCKEAQEKPAFENEFKRQHLNIRTEQAQRWLPLETWDQCAGPPIELDAIRGKPAYLGIDLSSNTDLTACVAFIPDAADRDHHKHAALPFYWIPADNAEIRQRRDRVPYLAWRDQGLIELTPGNTVDYSYLRKRVKLLAEFFDIQSIGFDPWNAGHICHHQLGEQDGLPVAEVRQGFVTMNEPCKRLETLILSRQLWHGGNSILRWNLSNVAVRTDASENLKFDKERSADRIDGLVALAIAVQRWTDNPDGAASVYDSRGVLYL